MKVDFGWEIPTGRRLPAVVAQLQDYTSLGVDCFILGFADEPKFAGIDLFINDVMPYFN